MQHNGKRAILLNKKQAKLARNNEQFAVRWLGREKLPLKLYNDSHTTML